MKLDEALKIYKENNPECQSFARTVYLLSPNDDNTYSFTDQNCNVPTKEEWKAMKVIIDHFYKNTTDEEIEEHNKNKFQVYKDEKESAPKNKRKHPGYVYLIKADNDLYKIGITKNLKRRLDHFTTKLPYEPELIHSIKTSDSHSLEKYFHERFAEKRKRGEWFALSSSDIEEVKAYVGS